MGTYSPKPNPPSRVPGGPYGSKDTPGKGSVKGTPSYKLPLDKSYSRNQNASPIPSGSNNGGRPIPNIGQGKSDSSVRSAAYLKRLRAL